tara:strand:- start:21265 stop:22032 length:768 start_codon:yes stop_codon:yes gene_type:complete
MNNLILFQMWSGTRYELIEKHEFYVSQAKSRLLEQFTDEAISKEADLVADESWEASGRNFNPDHDDPGDNAENAYQSGVWRYQLLIELKDSVRLNIISGFFHQWEKSFRQWIVDQITHWHSGEETKFTVWKANFDQLYELLECFGWDFKKTTWFESLDSCRLVVNVYKHGDGPSLNRLEKAYPQFLVHPLAELFGKDSSLLDDKSHEHMKVGDMDLDDFANAITQFWQQIPENVSCSQIKNLPTWLKRSIEKDKN